MIAAGGGMIKSIDFTNDDAVNFQVYFYFFFKVDFSYTFFKKRSYYSNFIFFYNKKSLLLLGKNTYKIIFEIFIVFTKYKK